MKKMISRVKDLSHKAAQLREAMHKVPPTLAEIRETVAATTGQLHQLRADVQTSVSDLKADNPDRISHALMEINQSVETFLHAGYDLEGVDMEISPMHRLIVHLDKVKDMHASVIRALMDKNQSRKTTVAILNAMLQAAHAADGVHLTGLDFNQLIVTVGPVPSVRLCWRGEQVFEVEDVSVTQHATSASSAAVAAPSTTASTARHSFFDRRPSQPTSATTQPAAATAPVVAKVASQQEHHEESESKDWKGSSLLDKYKNSPHFSKYGK